MSSLADIIKSLLESNKGKVDFNKIPDKVIEFSKYASMESIREAYFIVTGKRWTEKSDTEIIQELLYILLRKLRGDF